MIQPDDRARVRVDTGDIWTLVEIAVVAGKGQVIVAVQSSMLPGDDVLDVEGRER